MSPLLTNLPCMQNLALAASSRGVVALLTQHDCPAASQELTLFSNFRSGAWTPRVAGRSLEPIP